MSPRAYELAQILNSETVIIGDDQSDEQSVRFFEEVLAAYSSPRNYWLLIKATIFWRTVRASSGECTK